MPDVTVILPVFNGMPFLTRAVESILQQTLTDLRLVVINDGSTDDSLSYLQSVDDPRLTIVNGEHRGLGAALNLGLSNCSTPTVARMDADDISVPDRLEAQLDFLQRHPDIGVVGTQFQYFGGEGRFVFSPRMPCEHDEILSDLRRGRLSLVHASLVFRTEVIREIGGYRIQGMGEDWDLFLRLGEVTRFANLPQVKYLWRLHPGNTGVRRYRRSQMGTPYALECARRRAANEPEITFDEFIEWERSRGALPRLATFMDLLSLALYRGALAEIANGHTVRGYLRLGCAALCSPVRALQRVSKTVRRAQGSNQGGGSRTQAGDSCPP